MDIHSCFNFRLIPHLFAHYPAFSDCLLRLSAQDLTKLLAHNGTIVTDLQWWPIASKAMLATGAAEVETLQGKAEDGCNNYRA